MHSPHQPSGELERTDELPSKDDEEGAVIEWQPLWQNSLERMSSDQLSSTGSPAGPGGAAAGGSSSTAAGRKPPLVSKDAYIRTPGGGRMKMERNNGPPSSYVSRGAAPPRQQPKPSSRLMSGRRDSASKAGKTGQRASSSSSGSKVQPPRLRPRPQSFPDDASSGSPMDSAREEDRHVELSWDRQKLVKEMVALPRNKKAYLLKMLENMEKELAAATSEVPGGEATGAKGQGGGRTARKTDPAASPLWKTGGEEGASHHLWNEEACNTYPSEVLKIWAKVQKLRPYHGLLQPLEEQEPEQQMTTTIGGGLAVKKVLILGPSGLRERIIQDFDVRLLPKEVTALVRFFSTFSTTASATAQRSKVGGGVNYRDVANFLRKTSLPGSEGQEGALYSTTGGSSSREGSPTSALMRSAGGQQKQQRPIHQEEAARSVLSMPPPDETSRTLLEKIAAVAARTNKHELGNVFRADERRTLPMPVQEFKALLSTGLNLRLSPPEFSLLVQWFGNGLTDKSAAIDLSLFSQQFWALGSAAKTRRRKEEAQERFIRTLAKTSNQKLLQENNNSAHQKGSAATVHGTPPPPRRPQQPSPSSDSGGGGGGHHAAGYDDDTFEDERSVASSSSNKPQHHVKSRTRPHQHPHQPNYHEEAYSEDEDHELL